MNLPSFKNFRPYVLGTLLLVAIFVWHITILENVSDKLIVSVLNIGQGDAIFVSSSAGAQALVDGGPDRKILSELGKEMPFFDRSIDILMVSNPDKDHIAGFIDVLKNYKVKLVVVPGTVPNTEIFKTLLSTIRQTGAELFLAWRGEKIWLDDDTHFEILFPDRDVSSLDTNTGSIVAKLVSGQTSMLFTGDSPSGVLDYLTKIDGEHLKSDILKVAHHGSRNSLSLPFFGYVNPRFGVISVGAGNSYGHPHKEILDVLSQFGTETLRTDLLGTVRFFSDGEKFWREK